MPNSLNRPLQLLSVLLLVLSSALANASLSITRGSAIPAGTGMVAVSPTNEPSWSDRKPNPARAGSISGQVSHISGVTGRKLPLTEDTLIRAGDEILSTSGSATIKLADGSELRLSPQSRLRFNRLDSHRHSEATDTRLRLKKGELHSRVTPLSGKNSHFEITTPSAVASVRGTVFAIQTGNDGSSIQVTDGSVDFGSSGDTRRIPAGYGATLSTDSRQGLSIRPLPPAPQIGAMPEVINSLPVQLNWQYQWPTRYRLDIFEQQTGNWVKSREVTGTQHALTNLDNGRYEIQLAALNGQGIAGVPDTIALEVNVQARKPDLATPADGASVNDDQPQFQWQLNGTNERARVEIAETENFDKLVATSEWAATSQAEPARSLSPGQYYWRVATRAGGNSKAISDTRKVVINGTLPPVRIISVNYLNSQVRIYWEKVDTATDYQLQLSEEPEFRNIIKEADVDDTTAALRLIPGRRYFVRVKALSDGPLASRWGPGRELYLD
ncbi:FecR domain-containing protein [Marinobacter nauticus]